MSVFPLLSSVAGLIKVRVGFDRAVIDNAVFRLHYRTTATMMFVCCILVTANSLIGAPINCIANNGIPENVLNTYCWITSTFTLPGRMLGQVGQDVAYPGVGTAGGPEATYHTYYQWVPFMLFLQGTLFYFPHWLWKTWEEGRMRSITDGMRGAVLHLNDRKDRQTLLVDYISESMHLHNFYAVCYVICEVLNLVNVIGNIFFIDTFLNGAFLTYGTRVVEFSQTDQENRTDPMIEVFPRMTKCTFHKFGPSGTIQTHDSLCVLALNILNEKIYIFLWFWLVVLSVLTAVNLIYRMAQFFSPLVRAYVIQRRTRLSYLVGLDALIRRLQLGDFFVINMLGKNMDTLIYREVLDELARKLHLEGTISGLSPGSNEGKPHPKAME